MRFTFATLNFRRAWSRRCHWISPRFQSWRRWPRKNRLHRKPKLQLRPDRKSSPRRRKRAKQLLLLRVEKVLRPLARKARRRLPQEKVLRPLRLQKSKKNKSICPIRTGTDFGRSIARLWKKNQFALSQVLEIQARSTRTHATISDSWLSIF